MNGITDRQLEVLRAYDELTKRKGYPPTVRELGRYFGWTSTNAVSDHYRALERKGYLRRVKIHCHSCGYHRPNHVLTAKARQALE